MPGFLIEYQRLSGDVRVSEFATLRQATDQRLRLDRERAASDSDMEYVAIGAASREALERSHSRYFLRSSVTG